MQRAITYAEVLVHVLTLCCMFQMMNKVFGGTVNKKSVREDGVFSISLDNTCSLFRYSNYSCGLAEVFFHVLFLYHIYIAVVVV